MAAATPNLEELLTAAQEATTVMLTEDGVSFYGVSMPVLTRKEFFNKLTSAEKWEVTENPALLDELMAKRDETAIDESEADLAAMTAFLRKYGPMVKSTDAARKALAAKMLLNGADAARVQELSDVNYSVMSSWVSYKNARGTVQPMTKSVGDGIAKAKKASESNA